MRESRSTRTSSSRSSEAASFGSLASDSESPDPRDVDVALITVRSSPSVSCSTAIMPRPSRSTLMMPMSAQSSLSHCTTTRPGMLAFSSGTTDDELALADHHAAGMLAEMARQVLHLAATAARSAARGRWLASRPAAVRLRAERVGGIDELELVHHLRQPIDLRLDRGRAPCRLRAPRSGRDR